MLGEKIEFYNYDNECLPKGKYSGVLDADLGGGQFVALAGKGRIRHIVKKVDDEWREVPTCGGQSEKSGSVPG